MLNERQISLLIQYRDKTYVMQVLFIKSFEFYSLLKSVLNIPLILTSSVMAIMNSGNFEPESMKLPNIVINSSTAMLLAMINNFQISEKTSIFKTLSDKMLKLCHKIDNDLVNNLDTIHTEDIKAYIDEYDTILETNEHGFPYFIKNSVKRLYSGKRHMPSILNCEGDFTIPVSDVVYDQV